MSELKTRFGSVALAEIDRQIYDNKPKNTVKTEKYIWKQFLEFCKNKNYTLNESTSNETLALILKDWGFNMRQTDGSDYKEGTVKTIWNNTAKLLQKKYYDEFNRIIDPFKDVVFQSARNAKNTKRRQLQVSTFYYNKFPKSYKIVSFRRYQKNEKPVLLR